MYAHPPITSNSTTPGGYVQALEDRSAWADGLFLYYPTTLPFGARPEIDALQRAYPDGRPLTISAKNATAAGIDAFLQQLTPQQAANTLWERWQEPADNFTTPEARADFREVVERDIEQLRPAGVRVGVHEQCWTLDPANTASWAGEQALLELIPPDVDIVTFTCLGHLRDGDLGGEDAQRGAAIASMGRVLDFMHEHYPGVDIGFTSLGWSVPVGTPADSPLRAARAAVVRSVLTYAIAHGVIELGWFDSASWSGFDYGVASDPQLLAVLTDFHDRYITD